MEYAVEFRETNTVTKMIEATCWREALMKGIKMHDHGEIEFSDPPDTDVVVTGHPYKVTEVWTLEDMENIIRDKGLHFQPPLSDDEERQALLYAQQHVNKNRGICCKTIDKALRNLYGNRIVISRR